MATNNVESSKFLGYSLEAPTDTAVTSSKFLGYDPLAPTQTAVNASKVLGYAVLLTGTGGRVQGHIFG